MALQGKHILVAVTGSIAAYKSAYLVRSLVKHGCEVQVLMTDAAKAFVSPLTFSTLSKRPVYSTIIDDEEWNNHVDLGLWADAMVIAPATANTLSKCATATSDSLIVATYLSARCPVFVAPAMDLDMWAHPATTRNIEILQSDGVRIIPVEHGELASGLIGDGRMAEPDTIVDVLEDFFAKSQSFAGKRVLVTAGPTHEAIDPVRFIGNPSTGTMGLAIARVFAEWGASVSVVLGPTTAHTPAGVDIVRVTSAEEMYQATKARFADADIVIFSAAVADYTPANPTSQKIKKDDGPQTLKLNRTRDIAYDLGQDKKNGQIIVGFALETENGESNATDKLLRKNFDFIVLNSLEDKGAGFGRETNKVKLIYPGNRSRSFDLKSKDAVATDICKAVSELIHS